MKKELSAKIQLKSRSIFEEISIKLYGVIDNDRYLDHFHLIPQTVDRSILILGINPSSADINKGNEPAPVFIHHIPQVVKNKSTEIMEVTSSWNHGREGKKFCYSTYFNRIYTLFENTLFYPMWTSREYNERWELLVDNLKTRDIAVLRKLENRNIKLFTIVSDLIPIKETDSAKLFAVLDANPQIIQKLNTLFELKVRYLNPVLTVIFLQKADEYLAETLKKITGDLMIFPFVKYLPKIKYLAIKEKIEQRLHKKYLISNNAEKWDYIK